MLGKFDVDSAVSTTRCEFDSENFDYLHARIRKLISRFVVAGGSRERIGKVPYIEEISAIEYDDYEGEFKDGKRHGAGSLTRSRAHSDLRSGVSELAVPKQIFSYTGSFDEGDMSG